MISTATEKRRSAPASQNAVASERRSILHAWIAIGLLFALALALRLYQLGAQSLWLDELNTWWLVHTRGWGELWQEMWRGESAYPFYHLLLKGWVALAGDGEWALRFPSALAGALAVPVVALAAAELAGRREGSPSASFFPHPASLVLLASPFAIWYAQEVKTYSLLLLSSALSVWLLLRAMRRDDRASWLAFIAVALVSLFVHRFAALLLLGCAAGWLWSRSASLRPAASAAGWGLIAVAALAVCWQMVGGMGSEGATTGAHIPATPAQAALITLWRFALDRGPGEAPWPLLLPALALAAWGGALLLRDAWRGNAPARALACCLALPTALFLAQLWWTRLYEPRYLMIVFPCWALLLGYPFRIENVKLRIEKARSRT
jgi:mannosyltransferase